MEQETGLAIRSEVSLTPKEVVDLATAQSKLLMDIVEKTKCYQNISGKKYLQVEAWETIGAFNRTHAETESIKAIRSDESDPTNVIGYQAHVQLYKDGQVVGGAIMPCYFTENCCKGKEGDAKHKSAMSAAQTFATSKAYRMNYSYVAILAGFQPTPAEEMDNTEPKAEDKTKHWCEKHNTAFFKKGKMKAYAHPIVDNKGKQTGEWCGESMKEESKPEPEPEIEPEPIKELEPNTLEELQEVMSQCNWKSTHVGPYCKEQGWDIQKFRDLNTEQIKDIIEHIKANPK